VAVLAARGWKTEAKRAAGRVVSEVTALRPCCWQLIRTGNREATQGEKTAVECSPQADKVLVPYGLRTVSSVMRDGTRKAKWRSSKSRFKGTAFASTSAKSPLRPALGETSSVIQVMLRP
jgi:hypothetical protein